MSTPDIDLIGSIIGSGESVSAFGPGARVWSEMSARMAALNGYKAGREEVVAEVRSVLELMDGLAEAWGDEAVFRRCRDRLRKMAEQSELSEEDL